MGKMAQQKSSGRAEEKLTGSLQEVAELQKVKENRVSLLFFYYLKLCNVLQTICKLLNLMYWLVKQEPEKYSFDDLLKDGATVWDGVRNFQARNNLRAMKIGDKVLFYHSVTEKSVVGLAEVSREEFPDPHDEKWIAVEIKPLGKFAKAVTLEEIKAEKTLENIALIKQSRLSVMPLTEIEFGKILQFSEAK